MPKPLARAAIDRSLDDDEEIELPPLDAEVEEEPATDDDLADMLTPLDDEEDDPLDDAEASELETGVEISADDEAGSDADAASDGIDVGDDEIDEIDDIEDAPDDREGAFGDDDIDTDLDEPGDDGGTEGTGEPIEDEVDDAELPPLDADDEGDEPDEGLLPEALAIDESEGALPPWSASRWVVREGAGAAVPCCAVAVGRSHVVAAGDVVLIIDEGAQSARRANMPAGTSIALTQEAIVVGTARGGLFASCDAGKSATALAGSRARRGAVALSSTAERAWALSDGTIWQLATPTPITPAPVQGGGFAVAIASSDGALVALTRDGGEPRLERLRGDDGAWQPTQLAGKARRVAEGSAPLLAAAAGGRALALADAEQGVCVSRDGGASFRAFDLQGAIALAFAGEDVSAPLVVLAAREGDETSYLVEVSVEGDPLLVAEIPASAEEGGASRGALAWDGAREVVWVACRAGLLAVGRARRH